jgi:hypothetical protein
LPQALAQSFGLKACVPSGFPDEVGDLIESRGHDLGQSGSLAPPHFSQGSERRFEPGEYCLFVALPLHGVVGLLSRLEYAPQRQEAVQPGWLGIDLPIQLAHQLKDLLQGIGIDAKPGLSGRLRHRQLHRDRAPSEASAYFLAQSRLQAFEASRQS